MHSQVTTEVEFEYNSVEEELKVTFDEPGMWANYQINNEVWVGRLVQPEGVTSLRLSSNKIWEIIDAVEEGNYIVLYVPEGDVDILEPQLPGEPTAQGTILMSSMNMTALQVYFNNL